MVQRVLVIQLVTSSTSPLHVKPLRIWWGDDEGLVSGENFRGATAAPPKCPFTYHDLLIQPFFGLTSLGEVGIGEVGPLK